MIYIYIILFSFALGEDYSLSFDGVDDYIFVADDNSLDISNAITINVNVKLFNIQPHGIIAKGFHNTYGNYYLNISESGYMNFSFRAPNTYHHILDNTTPIPVNEWVALTVSYDREYVRFYINGNQINSFEYSDEMIVGPNPLYIGSHFSTHLRETMYGLLDKVSIWSRCLNSSEIKLIYDNDLDIYEEGLVGSWNFNSGSGDIVQDYSGNVNIGHIHGATWVENIYGCMDELAVNYNSQANIDDESCEYPDNGDYSLSFDGDDDYVQIPDLEVGNTYTIETTVFLKDDDISGQDFYSIINGWQGAGASSNCQFGVVAPHDKPYDDKLGYYKNGQGSVYGNKPDRNKYLKLNLVRNGSNFRLFINNQLVADEEHTDWNDDIYNLIGTWRINDAEIANRETWNGNIDDLKIWDYALSYEEINQSENSNNSENLIVDYQFNSGYGNTLYDHSGNGNHGVINGANWVENIYGCTDEVADNYNPEADVDDGSCTYPDNGDYSLLFDGYEDKVNLGSINSIDFNSFSIEVWILIDGSTGVNQPIVSRTISGINDHQFVLETASNGRNVQFVINAHQVNQQYVSHANAINFNEWTHLTINYSSDVLELFVDGLKVDSLINPDPLMPSSTDLFLAKDSHHSGWYLNGRIKRLILWDEARNSEQISMNQSQNSVDNEQNLTGLWKFNSGNGTTLYDHSGNGNHGTINGAKWLINGTKHVAVDGSDEEGNGSLDSPFSSIQYAIDTVSDSDTVLVSAGTYYENINFNGKNIALIGEDRETTIIDGGESGNVVQIANQEQNVSLINFTITNGSTDKGGGIYIDNTSPLLSNINIIGNSASENGAGLYVRYADLTIRDSFISNNSSGHDGGGIWFTQSLCSLENVTVESNFAENSGGGIHAFDRNSITMNSSYITENVANNCGGGVGLTDFSDLVIDSTSITNNETRGVDAWNMGSNGGGIFILNSSNVTLNESILSNNSAHLRGGAVYGAYDSNVSILNSSILNNIATNDEGGAMEIRDGSSAIIRDSKIMNNLGESTSGILVLIGSYIEINSSLFVNNISNIKDRGTIRFHIDSYGILNNVTIINENDETHAISMEVAGQYPIQIDNSIIFSEISVNSSDIYVSYSNINDGWNGSGNINQDPQFNADYTLQASSPCIDAGDPGGDLDPDGTRGDMGAYPVYQESYGTLHSGANLKSFYTLPENTLLSNVVYSLGNDVTGVITEGGAASQLSPGTWVGSLTEISPKKGYWIILDTERTLTTYDGIPSESLVYDLHLGANLISFPSSGSADVSDALPDDIENSITGIITEGGATTQLGPGFWVGSLSSFQGGKGYWVISDDDISFSYDLSTLSRSNIAYKEEKLNGYDYTQSSQQAFYFVESIEGINVGDYILSFNGDKLIGSRQWQGSIIDVPAMGNDGNSYSNGYMKTGDTPTFKLLSSGKLTTLEGDIPSWSDNGLFMVSSLSKVVMPEVYSLSQAYPNPFNPTTTLNFAIPVDNEVTLSIYNLQGREVATLINGNMKAGYHSITWDASANASGIYFVKMLFGEYVNTQKLMLIK